MEQDCERDVDFERRTREDVRDFLRGRFSLFREEHIVDVTGNRKDFQVFYGSDRTISENTTRIIVDVFMGDHGDVLDFRIRRNLRRRGHGRLLYECIEEFVRRYCCERVITMPSGDGYDFWDAMGFLPEGDGGSGTWEKML